ncbi:E3 ubiquitin-protein ligase AIP2 [Manihot esculenta]|nr:E3 ubiquitin-protein ligase AIP2 [Manihot esculenta]
MHEHSLSVLSILGGFQSALKMATMRVDVKLNSTSLLPNPMLPPIFLLELRFHRYCRRLFRNLQGESIQLRPVAPTSAFLFEIHSHDLVSEQPCKSHLYYLFSSINLDEPVRDFLAYHIACFLVLMANQQPFLGRHVVADTDMTLEYLIAGDPIGRTMIVDEEPREVVPRGASTSALNKLKKQRFFAKKTGDSDELSDDCVICLEGLSGSREALTKMTCNHIFHERCIFGWLKVQNSCPTCRRELED